MSYFSSKLVTFRIELQGFEDAQEPPLPHSGDWVDIKARRSLDDREAIQMAGVKIVGGKVGTMGFDASADLSNFNFNASRIERFKRAIVAWSLTDSDEPGAAVVPLTEATFRAMDDDLSDWLSEQIEAYYASRRPSKDAFLSLNGASGAA